MDMPGIDSAARFSDAYGNAVQLVNQASPDGALMVNVTGTVVTTDRAGVLGDRAVNRFRRSTSGQRR
ncbi:MAG: hypothetical protein MO852_15820 [Candidatus Devosia euplotis]|nr:hypothetical protein [Candidatus Devosia euplotis]